MGDMFIYFYLNDAYQIRLLKEFVFSHDKAAKSLKEYFHALEMDKTHIYVVFTY